MKRSHARTNAARCLCALLLLCAPVVAQKKKFNDAVERSKDAGRIIELLALVPEGDLPRELIDRAEAVGVFPKVERETLLFTHMTQGYGVISARTADGWSAPAYYQFMGGNYGSPFAEKETYGVILLFMTKEAVAGFEKGGVRLKGERKALAGPVGAITDEQRKELEGAHILAYSYFNGRLKGTGFGSSFWKNFMLDPDNNINKPLYGMKGREVLAGAKFDATALPSGIDAFRSALQKYYGAPASAAKQAPTP